MRSAAVASFSSMLIRRHMYAQRREVFSMCLVGWFQVGGLQILNSFCARNIVVCTSYDSDDHRRAQPSLCLLATPSSQACFDASRMVNANGRGVQVQRQECFTQAARAVFGSSKDDSEVDAFVVQALSSTESLDSGTQFSD